jgi:radical SAM protein with 4Fe4S-binding SPASM domain
VEVRLFKKFGYIPPLPKLLMVEVTNRCNSRCIMCDRQSMTRPQGNMDLALFKRAIDNAAALGIQKLQLNRFGEPLLHPSLVEMTEYAIRKGIRRAYFASNASLLNPEIAQRIIDSGLHHIILSLDGATAETFEHIRRGLKYKNVRKNIENFLELRAKEGRKYPYVVLNTILMKETEQQMGEVMGKWGKLVDELNVISAVKYGGIENHSSINRSTLPIKRGPCLHLSERLAIFWNGDVTVCCGDVNGDLRIGNIAQASIEELWNSAAIDRIRRIHASRDFSQLPICEGCDGTNYGVLQAMRKQEAPYR